MGHTSGKNDLEQLLTVRFGQLMIRSDSYPSVGELVSAAMPYIAAANQQAAQTALETIGEPPFGDFNIKPDSYDDVIKAIRWYKSAIQAVQTALAGKQKELELKFVEFDPDVVKLISENLHDLF